MVVVGNGVARITDGSYERDLPAAVLGKHLHLQIVDADHDTSENADKVEATIQIFRRKTPDEIDDELAKGVASGELVEGPDGEDLKSQIDPLLMVRSVPVSLREQEQRGTFRLAIPLRIGTAEGTITGEAGQIIRLVYRDDQNLSDSTAIRTSETNRTPPALQLGSAAAGTETVRAQQLLDRTAIGTRRCPVGAV